MPSLKEIKTRIASVNNTRKITSAMKMVASSKLRHAQQMIENMLPYDDMLEHILKSFLLAEPEVNSPYCIERSTIKRVALVVFASNSSLCGGFNVNIIKAMLQAINSYSHLYKEDIVVYPVGRKVYDKVQKLGLTCAGDFAHLAESPTANTCQLISEGLASQFLEGKIDKVELIYHHFKSAGSQVLTRRTFLPIDLTTELNRAEERDLTSTVATAESQAYLKKHHKTHKEASTKQAEPLNDNFIVEPNIHVVLKDLIPKQLNLMFYTAALDSNASEHAARMVAMQTATDNADEILRELSLQYNKSRQQAITNELLDIVGGSINN